MFFHQDRLAGRHLLTIRRKLHDRDVSVGFADDPLLAKNEPVIPVFPEERVRPDPITGRQQLSQRGRLWVQQPLFAGLATQEEPLAAPSLFLFPGEARVHLAPD